MDVCYQCCVLSGRGLCNGLITRPEESYRLWCVVVCDQEILKTRRLKPTTRLWKIQSQWVVTSRKQTNKQTLFIWSQDGKVSIMNRLIQTIQSSNLSKGKRCVSSPEHRDRLCGPNTEVRWLGREVDHSPPYSGKVKNECSYSSIPAYTIMMWTRTLYPFPPFTVDMEYFSGNYWQHTFHNPNYTTAPQMNTLGSHKYISHVHRPLLLLIRGDYAAPVSCLHKEVVGCPAFTSKGHIFPFLGT